jgi:hypothetical protein
MAFFWRYQLASNHERMTAFVELAPGELRGHAFSFAGRAFANQLNAPSAEGVPTG